ncbi:MAG TPA: DNA-directed RNA polymerase subunit D [Candidatus Nanoarchaeia archaeon]|nr:DNA-directed RNA polymerase subunit D [Candidatus Nanoarchaeia archaeon]
MKLELLQWDKKANLLQVRLDGASASFANLVRRFSMDEVPTLAIEDIDFHDNSSALYDEMIAHRLGLIPIKTDLSSYTIKQECSCGGEGCAKCQLKITLKAAKKGLVTAGEAKSADPKCTFVYDDMPVVKLAAKQKLEIEAIAILGRGREHAKWSPCLAHYKHEVTINTSSVKFDHDQKARLQRACGNLAQVDGKVKVDEEKLQLSQNSEACLQVLEEVGAELKETENIIFTIESWGQLNCKEILDTAADLIIKELDLLKEKL